MADVRTIHYNCKKTPGNGSASPYLTPLFQAWGESRRLAIVPGTLNLCAHRDVICPTEFISLRPWDRALTLEWRKSQPGYDPRLYFVVLENKEPGWLFRWSDDRDMGNFVGDTPDCDARRFCELIAETHLSSLWPLDSGHTVQLRFL